MLSFYDGMAITTKRRQINMLFLDDTAQTEPQRKITLDLSQDATTIQQHIVALSQNISPK